MTRPKACRCRLSCPPDPVPNHFRFLPVKNVAGTMRTHGAGASDDMIEIPFSVPFCRFVPLDERLTACQFENGELFRPRKNDFLGTMRTWHKIASLIAF